MELAVDRIQERIRSGQMMGTLGHEESTGVSLDRVSHVVQSLTRRGDSWVGRSRVVDAGAGNILKAIIDAGGKVGMSSRGAGSIKTKGGVHHVQEDFTIFAIDCVADPIRSKLFCCHC